MRRLATATVVAALGALVLLVLAELASAPVEPPCAPDMATRARVRALIAQFVRAHGAAPSDGPQPRPRAPAVVGTYACPLRLGNMMHEFTNAFILAIVLNRTFTWAHSSDARYANGVPRDSCGALFQRRAWIPWLPHHLACDERKLVGFRCAADALDFKPNSTDAWRLLAECGADAFGAAELLSLQRQWGQSALPMAHASSRSGPEARRARLLFSAGAPFLYGALLEATFETLPALSAAVSQRLRALKVVEADGARSGGNETLWLGIHLRYFRALPKQLHRQTEAERAAWAGRESGKAYGAVVARTFEMLGQTRLGAAAWARRRAEGTLPRRVLLLASDWVIDPRAMRESLDLSGTLASGTLASGTLASGTLAVVTAETLDFDRVTGALRHREPGSRNEHGARAQRGALLDVELLSRADALIVSIGSTFSAIIEEGIAARAAAGSRPFVLFAESGATRAKPATAQGLFMRGLLPCPPDRRVSPAWARAARWPPLAKLRALARRLVGRVDGPPIADWPTPVRAEHASEARWTAPNCSAPNVLRLPMRCQYVVNGDGGRRGCHWRR